MADQKTARQAVLDGLCSVLGEGAYSAIVLDHIVKDGAFDRRDIGFATRLFYGVLERSVTLDYCITTYAGKPLHKLDLQVVNILRMGLYQLKYMDAVPDSAAVNESVKLIGYAKKMSAKGFVNALLRRFIREGKNFPMPDPKKDALAALAVETACPKWILSLWKKQYGFDFAEQTALSMLEAPNVDLRVNPLITCAEALKAELEQAGFAVRQHEHLPHCLSVTQTAQSIDKLASYQKGAFYVQDIASQYCVSVLDAKPGERILDMCAAPGGKSIGAAMDMGNKGEICSFDLYEHKVKLIEQNAARLGLTAIKAGIGDAAVFDAKLGQFDRVLCDVPCSGLGVMRRKPEIRFKDEKDVKALPELQYKILCNATRYVKKGGVLIYSTCTVNKEENAAVCARFLKEHTNFAAEAVSESIGGMADAYGMQLLPQLTGSDGFYFAKLRNIEENDEHGKN